MPVAQVIAADFVQVENDLYINPATGDFRIGASDNQHIQDILEAFPGWYKEFPAVGAGIPILLKGKLNPQIVEATIKQQLEADGYQLQRPEVTVSPNGRVIIRPNAKRINL